MNPIQRGLGQVTAREEVKERTRDQLRSERRRRERPLFARKVRYGLAAVCACLAVLLGVGGYQSYAAPVSYISIDVNPSIELGLNRFDRVVQVVAYNDDGSRLADHLSLKNRTYQQAIDALMEDAQFQSYLSGRTQVVFTVVSDREAQLREGIESQEWYARYGQCYEADVQCLHEAHENGLSVGKYRAYLELAQYDDTVTVEDCHRMTMGELQQEIKRCKGHGGSGYSTQPSGHGGHHNGHHG